MVWELFDVFNKRQMIRDKAFVQNAVAVDSAFTPSRHSHVNGSVPRWRNEHASVLWAYRGMVIHQAMMEQEHVWVWRDNPVERQPAEPTQPTPASESPRQPDCTPEAIGTWAAKQKASTVLCHVHQHNTCADSCAMRALNIALHDSGCMFYLRYPVRMHRWDTKHTEQDCRRPEPLAWFAADGANSSGQPAAGPRRQNIATKPMQQPRISNMPGCASENTPAIQSSSHRVVPQQGNTDVTEIDAVQRTEVLDHQSGSEVLGEAVTGDECPPPPFVGICVGTNRPMNRTMDWCGWTTSFCEEPAAGYCCVWKNMCVDSINVEVEVVHAGIFSHLQKAQAIWFTPGCCTWSEASSPIRVQGHLPKPLRLTEDFLGTSSRVGGEQQIQGSEPLSTTERSWWLEPDSGITCKVVLKSIHERSNSEGQQLAIIGDLGDTWLWSRGFTRPRWCQDTVDDVVWTDAVCTSWYLATTSLPREVPLMHTQEDFNRFVIKVAPDSSMQSCQTQHIKELISMEPRTWWRKFLGKKGK